MPCPRTALPLRLQSARAAMACHQLDRERRAHLQVGGSPATRPAAIDKGNHPLAQVQRVASPMISQHGKSQFANGESPFPLTHDAENHEIAFNRLFFLTLLRLSRKYGSKLGS